MYINKNNCTGFDSSFSKTVFKVKEKPTLYSKGFKVRPKTGNITKSKLPKVINLDDVDKPQEELHTVYSKVQRLTGIDDKFEKVAQISCFNVSLDIASSVKIKPKKKLKHVFKEEAVIGDNAAPEVVEKALQVKAPVVLTKKQEDTKKEKELLELKLITQQKINDYQDILAKYKHDDSPLKENYPRLPFPNKKKILEMFKFKGPLGHSEEIKAIVLAKLNKRPLSVKPKKRSAESKEKINKSTEMRQSLIIKEFKGYYSGHKLPKANFDKKALYKEVYGEKLRK